MGIMSCQSPGSCYWNLQLPCLALGQHQVKGGTLGIRNRSARMTSMSLPPAHMYRVLTWISLKREACSQVVDVLF